MDGLRDLDGGGVSRPGAVHPDEVHADEVRHETAEDTDGAEDPPPKKEGGGGREPRVLVLKLLRSASGGAKPRDGRDAWVPTDAAAQPSGGKDP